MAIIDNLISYYKLDENAANTTVADAHGANTGTASTNTNNLYNASGKINSAFDLDGSTEKVALPNTMLTAWSEFSISAWVKTDTLGTTRRIVSKDDNAVSYQQTTRMTSTNKFDGIVSTVNSGFNQITGTTTISADTWYHVVLTYDGSNINLYVDGSSDATPIAVTGALLTKTDVVTVGGIKVLDVENWDGLIDEVGIWDKALTSDEVTELYNSGSGLAYPFAAPEVAVELSFQTDGLNYVVQPQ